MNKFSSRVSYIIVTFFMAAIIISFALTGFQGFNSSSNAVATVDGTPITITEYNRMLNAQIQQYSQYFGGKALSAQQIRQFRIKEMTLQTLVQQKLIQNLAQTMKFDSSEAEMKEEIRKTPFFLTDGKFDVKKYKAILTSNNYSPAKYEEIVKSEISSRKMTELFTTVQVSDNYARDVLNFKKNTVTLNAVQFEKEKMTKFIKVSASEIEAFVADKKNEAILNSLFKSMQNEFNRPARVKARHILLKMGKEDKEDDILKKAKAIKKKLNKTNFAQIAGKETQDPSGKGKKGGDLGWFEKGRMVPEFEKMAFSMQPGQISEPVKTSFGYHIILVEDKEKAVTKTLEQVQDKVAKRHLQKSNRKGLNELVEDLKQQAQKALEQNNIKALKKMKDDYEISFFEKKIINEYDQDAGDIGLSSEKIVELFHQGKNMAEDDGPLKVVLAKVVERKKDQNFAEEIAKSLKDEVNIQNRNLATQIQRDLLQGLEKLAKVVTYPKLL